MTDQLNILRVEDLNSRYLHRDWMLSWEFKKWLELYELDGWDGMHVARSPFCSYKVMSLKQSSSVAERDKETADLNILRLKWGHVVLTILDLWTESDGK